VPYIVQGMKESAGRSANATTAGPAATTKLADDAALRIRQLSGES